MFNNKTEKVVLKKEENLQETAKYESEGCAQHVV